MKTLFPSLQKKIIKKHGHNKIFFGTDYPFAPIGKSVKIAKAFPFLIDNEKKDIFGLNAQRFYLSCDSTIMSFFPPAITTPFESLPKYVIYML